jgi:hypothetical protein
MGQVEPLVTWRYCKDIWYNAVDVIRMILLFCFNANHHQES